MSMSQTSSSTRGLAVRRLSPSECRHWLDNHHVGRLAYGSGRGPRCVVVSYTVAEEQIVVRLPAYHEIVQYAPGAVVTFEVEDRADLAPGLETVTVSGTAALVCGDERLTDVAFVESWPAGVSTSVVRLPMTAVEGYERADR